MTEPSAVPDPNMTSKRIASYSRRYAENRGLVFLVMALSVVAMGILLFGGLALAVTGYVQGPSWLLPLGVVAALLGLVACVWSDRIIGFGGIETIRGWAMRLYAKDGFVPHEPAFSAETSRREMAIRLFAWIIPFMACVFGHQFLVMNGVLAANLTVPVSVVYVVPLTLWAYWVLRWKRNRWFLLIPVLYTAYALLVLAGAPIVVGELPMANVCIPLVAAQLMSSLIGHIYSRHALARLREVARVDGEVSSNE